MHRIRSKEPSIKISFYIKLTEKIGKALQPIALKQQISMSGKKLLELACFPCRRGKVANNTIALSNT
jgi:hypothetical protein